MSKDNHDTKTTSTVIFAFLAFLGAMAFGASFWMVVFVTFLSAFFGLILAAWALQVTGRIR